MRKFLAVIAFLTLIAGVACAQNTQTFNQFVGGLPPAGNIGTADSVYLLQNGQSKNAPLSSSFMASWLNSLCGTTIGQVWVRMSNAWGCSSLGYLNPVWFGADPTGAADSAPAFRTLFSFGSNKLYFIQPGTYRFASAGPPPSDCPTCVILVLIDSLSNFLISGYGVVINIDASVGGNTPFQINRSSNFVVSGLKINQNSHVGCCNSGWGLVSNVGFHMTDLSFGPGLTDQAFFGDFLVNGVIDHVNIVHGQCLDMAYLLHMKFDDFNADGGNNTDSGLCVGVNTDHATPPSKNQTGYSIPQSDDVTFTRFNVSGYSVAILLSSGTHYRVSNSTFHDMPGTGTAPVGVSITYFNGGNADSTGFPVHGVQIENSTFYNSGGTIPGNAITIDTSSIVNADQITNVLVSSILIDNWNFCGVCSNGSSWASHVSNIFLGSGISTTSGEPSQAIDPIITAVASRLNQGAIGVSCSGAPSGSFATNNGVVTHC